MKKLFDVFPYIEGDSIILKNMFDDDVLALRDMINNKNVYRYLPTFLGELKNQDTLKFIRDSYTKYFLDKEAIYMGVYLKSNAIFCGIAEIYHYDSAERKVTLGYRLAEEYWGKGIATEIVALITTYLFEETDVEQIVASHITVNPASGKVLAKNRFKKMATAIEEDWGYEQNKVVDKWCLIKENAKDT